MFASHKARTHARAALLLLAALLSASHAAAQAPAAQTDPPRRPQGPVVGPAIKLPRGAGADDARTQPTGTREGETAEVSRATWAAPLKWEYCYIKDFKYVQKGISLSSRTPAAVVRYLPAGSDEIEGASEEEALGNAFAKLGEDGWELAGLRTDFKLDDGNGNSSTVYFFKRPKRQE